MALSNWDTMAFDENGKPCSGIVTNADGSMVEIYRNYLYVHSPKMWRLSGGYRKSVIAEMMDGDIELSGFHIIAKRSDTQNAVFVFCKHSYTAENGYKYFGGIGCSGYVNKIEQVLTRIGRKDEISDDWCYGSEESGVSDYGRNFIHHIMNLETHEKIVYWDEGKKGEYDYSKDWIGVTEKLKKEFFAWMSGLGLEYSDVRFQRWLARCRKSKGLRFNQGDAYFAKRLKKPIPATRIGKQKSPVMMKMIGKK